MSAGEVQQAVGSRAFYQYALEASWGTLNPSANWRKCRLKTGESVDQNLAIYRSEELRGDRMKNPSVRGSQNPGGAIPWELSSQGWNPWLWNLLGGSVTTTGPVAGVPSPGTPTAAVAGTGGTLPAGTTYQYEVTAISAAGETLPSTASAAATTTGTTSTITITWTASTGAIGYRIYGRTTGSFLFMASVGPHTLTWTDLGLITPVGAAPVSDTSGSIYTHVFAGATDVPVGFTLEKGFTDIGAYIPYYGCRVNKMSLDFNIDAIAAGSFDILARQEGDVAQASLNTGAFPTTPMVNPFTSAQIQVYEGSSLALLGTTRKLKLEIDNDFQGKRGFVLGSTLRQNLRPGDRTTTVDGDWMFQNAELYEAAIRGDDVAFRILATDGIFSFQVDIPSFQFIPNGSTPKAKDTNQIEISLKGEGDPNSALGSDVQFTIKTPEASIVT